MSVKARKRIKHVREDDIANPTQSGGMCSTQKSTSTIIAERKEEQERSEVETKQPFSEGSTTCDFTQGQGEDNVKETIDSKSNIDEPNGTGTDNEDDSAGSKVGSQGTRVLVEKTDEEKRREVHSKLRIEEMNKGADAILSCLEPTFAREFYQACEEYKCKDIGIYVLALLNRLSKQADYYDIDFEPEWEAGEVGFLDKLKCNYCNKEIVNPTRMKQKYCSNLCAKYDREKNQTGLIFPEQTVEGITVKEQEEEAYNDEKKRLGEE